jgi:hypothetical protein|nr:MAG TPA: tail tape measure [Caudoviricetes sp.]
MSKKHLSEDEIRYIVSAETGKAQQEIHALTKETKGLKKEERERRKTMVDLESQGKKNSKEYKNLEKEVKKYSNRISENNDKVRKLTRQLDVNAMSMRQLKKLAKELAGDLEDMSEAANPEEYAALSNQLRSVRMRMDDLRNKGRNISSEFGSAESMLSKWKMAAKAFIAVKLVGYLTQLNSAVYRTRKEFAKYEAVLRNTFQSQEKATQAMKMLQQLAADTPASLKEWTEAYIKLVNRGLKPTSRELTNMGDLASSQGKSVDQLIEAILDAMTGENERLKEFGIKAAKSGETTKFTFRGVTTEVRNSEQAIKDYLLSLGQLEGVAGSMAVQMQELEGMQSNFGDTVDSVLNRIGKKMEPFYKGLLRRGIDFFSTIDKLFTSHTEVYEGHLDQLVQLESTVPQLMSRYEELSSKTSLNTTEQKELAGVISQITSLIPGAASAFDDLGNAIAISGEKVDEYLKKQKALLKFENTRAISELEKQIEEYTKKRDELQKQYDQGGKTVFQSNGMFGGYTSYVDNSEETLKQIDTELKKYITLVTGAEEKLKRINGQTLEDAVQQHKDKTAAQERFNKMNKSMLAAWLNDEKNAADQYREIAQEIYDKRFPDKPVDFKEVQKARETDEKAQLDAEKQLIADLKSLRDQKLSEEQKATTASLNIQKLLLLNKKISQKEYDIWEAAHENNSADKRLSIEKDFAAKSENLNLKHNELKEAFVKESANRVEKAEQTSFDTRLKAEQTYCNNIDALRKMAEQTLATPEAKLQAEYETNLQLTEAFYQSSLEYAREHGQSETEITALYNQAKLNLDKKYQEEKKKLVKQTTEELKALQGNEISAQFTEIFNSITKLQDAIANMDFEGVMQSMQALVNATLNGLSDAFNTFKQIEIDNVEAKYDAEIKAAQGNGEEIERLEQEKAQKKLDVEKKYADVQFAIKASEILANTALAITMALAQLGPIAGPIAAGLMGATGAIQLAAANAERQKVKNMTLSGSSSSSRSGARVATGRESGGKIDVKRAQDGKLFPDADYDPDARGFIDRPTVIVGEGPSGHSKEWVASNAAVSNPTIAPILNILDKSQQAGTIRTLDLNQVIRARMAGYSSGGTISKTTVSSPDPISPDSGVTLTPELMRRFANAIINIDEHGIPASVSLTEFERKQQLRDRSRNLAKK